MRRRRGGVISIGLILTLVAALVIAWLGYEPMVLRRMSEEKTADAACGAAIVSSAGVIRQFAVAGDPNAADLDYAFNVQNRAQGPCLAKFEYFAVIDGRRGVVAGDRLIQAGQTAEISAPLGRYTRAEAAQGRLPTVDELKVWGVNPLPLRQ